jgi:hypothetical protein
VSLPLRFLAHVLEFQMILKIPPDGDTRQIFRMICEFNWTYPLFVGPGESSATRRARIHGDANPSGSGELP